MEGIANFLFFLGETLNLRWVCEKGFLGVGWKGRVFDVLLLLCLERLRLSNQSIVWHI